MTVRRLEIYPLDTTSVPDSRGRRLCADLAARWPSLATVTVVDAYTITAALDAGALAAFAGSLTNPVAQRAHYAGAGLYPALPDFDMALEIGFLPGVTDNTGHTARQVAEDILDRCFAAGEAVFSSRLYLLRGIVSCQDAEALAGQLANPLIQRVHIKPAEDFRRDGGMETVVPAVHLHGATVADTVSLDVDDAELARIGREGIADADGIRRGPLGLRFEYMQAIQRYFAETERRAPRDIELETLAQTWSEHCKHTIFADPIDEISDGLYRHYIKRATQEIRAAKGKGDFCVSVFTDNSGAIVFDEEWLVTDKAETHNSPSALDPFGGAITGIVGVNRDTLGFGLGAKPILNRYGFCFADPREHAPLYRDRDGKQPMLSPRFIMEGVVHGINAGGNCSGIPTPQGFVYFDPRYRGKPLVFAGTVGLIPRRIGGKPSHEKAARSGDVIVMVGGRVGKDGIHGATFSSVALDEGSPATAVQIGDPITQKKLSDAILCEARDRGMYHAITDNGAGGLSSSVGEMAQSSGGFAVELERVPLKYPGMAPWEIWISESQERMTLAVPPEQVEPLLALLASRDVEATVIGHFTDSGRAHVTWRGETVMDMDMAFLHDGLPRRPQRTEPVPVPHYRAFDGAPPVPPARLRDASPQAALPALLSSLNICSKAFISTQYDHEVQAGSVLKPLQGRGRVNAEATVTRPVLSSWRGIVTAQGIVPRYSDLDSYHMAACAVDSAVRAAVAAGANPDHLALMDNFCWCSSDDPRRLYQLKRAAGACYDMATAFGAPFISGKDSMFNDFRGFDADGKPVQVSIPPTLLISALSVIPDIRHTVSLDAKRPGDVVYVLGDTNAECGASEYLALFGRLDGEVPRVNPETALARYRAFYQAVQQGLVRAAIPVGIGGIGVALAKMTIAGNLGMQIDISAVNVSLGVEELLFSESQSRIVVAVSAEHSAAFAALLGPHALFRLGEVMADTALEIQDSCRFRVEELAEAYRAPLAEY